jgi:pyridoxal phosphate enzyme (YggS family)
VTIADNWREVRERVAAACRTAGRDPGEVTIIAVSKTHPASAVLEAAAAGATDFGENYAQELVAKRAECPPKVEPGGLAPTGGVIRWHFIGRLQRNKAKLVAGQVALVHAVDSVELAAELGKRAGGVQPVLLAVNVAGEDTKGGVTQAAAPELARAIARTPGVRLDGLMTMPPPDEDPRPHFDALRALRDRLAGELGPLPVLSMGMSGDFEAAIACGATHVRIGTAIFGVRDKIR